MEKISFSSDIYPFYSLYEQELNNGTFISKKAFSLADPSTYEELFATKNSKLTFFDRDLITARNTENDDLLVNRIIEQDYVLISKPKQLINIPIIGKITPKQIYYYLGNEGRINEDEVSVITLENSFKDSFNEFFDGEDLVAISFPAFEQELIEVEIRGEVKNPGIYKVARTTTMEELYTLAGGMLSSAFDDGISLQREDIRIKEQLALDDSRRILTDSLLQKSASSSVSVDIESILKNF